MMVPLREPPLFLIKCIQLLTFTFMLSSISVFGTPLTGRQFFKVRKFLEKKVALEFPTDESDNSDYLIQTKVEDQNLTFYHQGDTSNPVFVSLGLKNAGKKTHVLHRGEDYLNWKDEHTFVVLKQTSKPDQYSVHRAYVMNTKNIKKNTKVIWYDSLVEQKKQAGLQLKLIGDTQMQARALRSRRPRCDWIGFFLMCESKRDVPNIRDRERVIFDKILDVEITEPDKLFVNPDAVGTDDTDYGGGAGGTSAGTGGGSSKAKGGAGKDKKPDKPAAATPKPGPTAGGAPPTAKSKGKANDTKVNEVPGAGKQTPPSPPDGTGDIVVSSEDTFMVMKPGDSKNQKGKLETVAKMAGKGRSMGGSGPKKPKKKHDKGHAKPQDKGRSHPQDKGKGHDKTNKHKNDKKPAKPSR